MRRQDIRVSRLAGSRLWVSRSRTRFCSARAAAEYCPCFQRARRDCASPLAVRATSITIPGEAVQRTSHDLTSSGALWFVGGREWSGLILESRGFVQPFLLALKLVQDSLVPLLLSTRRFFLTALG